MKSNDIKKWYFKTLPSVRETLNIISCLFLAMKVDLHLFRNKILVWSTKKKLMHVFNHLSAEMKSTD